MSNVFEGTRFCIHTFGCQMNKHDSERVAGMLEGLGSLPVETIEEADIVVFMTCCVREAADTRLYGQVAPRRTSPCATARPRQALHRRRRLHRPARRRQAACGASHLGCRFSALTIWALCRGFSDAPSSGTAAPPK
ncbi:MAG: hypothetical protein ACLTDR_06870 [Adlercreutzia equolifaciens]